MILIRLSGRHGAAMLGVDSTADDSLPVKKTDESDDRTVGDFESMLKFVLIKCV